MLDESRKQTHHDHLTKLVTTLLAWLAAFLIVMAILTLFGPQLRSQPLAVRALAVSGVLVVVMSNVVMPAVTRMVARWLAHRSRRPISATKRPPGPSVSAFRPEPVDTDERTES